MITFNQKVTGHAKTQKLFKGPEQALELESDKAGMLELSDQEIFFKLWLVAKGFNGKS